MSSNSDLDDSVRTSISRLHGDPETRVQTLTERAPTDERLTDQTEVFSALAHPDRIRILSILRDGECCVCELQAALDSPQSTVASHLRTLRDAGMVNTRKDGKWTHYRIADTATLQLLDIAAALGGDGE